MTDCSHDYRDYCYGNEKSVSGLAPLVTNCCPISFSVSLSWPSCGAKNETQMTIVGFLLCGSDSDLPLSVTDRLR